MIVALSGRRVTLARTKHRVKMVPSEPFMRDLLNRNVKDRPATDILAPQSRYSLAFVFIFGAVLRFV
jgi:hypothetical protein